METTNTMKHPLYNLFTGAPPRLQRRVETDECPGCGKTLKAFGQFITVHDDEVEPLLLAFSAVCWRCANRLESSPTQRLKIQQRIIQTMRLAVAEVGGNA